MLTKNQARAFFLGGTLFFSAVFIFLTVDTLAQMDTRTNMQNLTAEVTAGKFLFERKNCMGCHTILGEGGYYAPDLTKVVKNRGKEWIRVFIKDPEAMFPGKRKMPKYGFTETELDQMIAFLTWIGEIDTNGWPPEPNLKPAQKPVSFSKTSLPPMPKKYKQLCVACHALGGSGGNVGPALDNIGTKFDAVYLDKWLKNPAKVKPGTTMPALPLTEQERAEIVSFLSGIK